MKLAIGSAWSSPFIWTRFTESALNLQQPPGYETKWFFGQGWCPARRHTDICERALEWGADLILFAGCDQVYDPDTLVRLVNRFNEGYEVVAALVPARGYFDWNREMRPFQPMAWRFKSQQPVNGRVVVRPYRGQALDADMIEVIRPEDGPIQRVNFIGSGVLLFHRDHLLSLQRPWFVENIDPVTYERHASMDCVFVWRLQTEASANVYVDTTIDVKHINAFLIDRTFSDRFADWATPGVGDPSITRFKSAVPTTGQA